MRKPIIPVKQLEHVELLNENGSLEDEPKKPDENIRRDYDYYNSFTFDELWRFYLDSNFIYKSKLDFLKPYLPVVAKNWSNLLSAGSELTYTALRRRKNVPKNSLSMTKYYPSTWIIQHMVSQRDPLGMLTVLLGSLSWFIKNDNIEYGKIYWRPENTGPNLLFSSLAHEVVKLGEEACAFQEFDYYCMDVTAIENALPDSISGFKLLNANDAVKEETSNKIKAAIGPLLYSSDAFHPADIDLFELNLQYGYYNLHRTRRLLPVAKDGEIIAVAVCELSSLGLNLSYYFNKFSIILLSDELDERTRLNATAFSIKKAVELYKNHGRAFVVSLNEHETLPEMRKLGLRPVKQYLCLSASKESGALHVAYNHIDSYYQNRMTRKKGKSIIDSSQTSII